MQKPDEQYKLHTNRGLEITVSKTYKSLDSALDYIYSDIDRNKGILLSSGFDYPGRHSRWDLGFINPALEIITKEKSFLIKSLNQQGKAVLKTIAPVFKEATYLEAFHEQETVISGTIKAQKENIPEELRSKEPSCFSVFRDLISFFHCNDPLFSLFGLYGALGYDLIQQFEKIELKHTRPTDLKDCHLYLPLKVTAIDRKKEEAFDLNFNFNTPLGLLSELDGGGDSYELHSGQGSAEIESDHRPGEFAKKVEQVVEGTKRGDYFEVVLSQSFSTRYEGKPTELFSKLADINPSPYMFLMNFGNEQLVGSSPEIFARITGRNYETCPIAGTVRRGESALEDADRVKELISSLKDESELTMCTDVDRNDMARVCVPGSVQVIGRRQLEFYSHLIHTVDHLQGTLGLGFDAIDAFQTHMWACTVTGAPKPAAVQEIENLEANPRGWYSGAVGLFAFNGDLNTGITIRTANLKNGRANIRAGATLLYGSDPDAEEQETRTKAAAFLSAITSTNNKQPATKTTATVKATPVRHNKKVLFVDYRDSFVHNLAAYFRDTGADVITLRTGFPESKIDEITPDLVLLSPGPGTPEQFGMSHLIEKLVARNLPIFGVCLGHQGLGQYFGAKLGQLPLPVHGKETKVLHTGNSILTGIDSPFEVGRYHSLYLEEEGFPDELEILAKTEFFSASIDPFPVIMAFKHKRLPIAGVQFHPESIMTLKGHAGHKIINNVISELAK